MRALSGLLVAESWLPHGDPIEEGMAVSADYLWGVSPRSADDPLVASGESDNLKYAQRQVELVLDLKPQVASWGTVTGPRGYHAMCRRDGMGGFTWEKRGGGLVAGPHGREAASHARKGTARPKKTRDTEPGRLYREAQNDYWDARSRRARRGLAFRGFTRGILIVVIAAVVVVCAGYVAHRMDPRLPVPGYSTSASGGANLEQAELVARSRVPGRGRSRVRCRRR